MTRRALVAAFLIASLTVVAGVAVAENTLDQSHDAVPNPLIDVDNVSKNHDMTWGTDASALRTYENDQGDTSELQAHLNTTPDNPFTLRADRIIDEDLGAFPRVDDGDVSALDSSEWSTGGQNSSSFSVSNAEPSSGVEAVQIETDGSFGSDDRAYASFSNWSTELDNDEMKRIAHVGVNVNTLDGGAEVNISVIDEGGNYIDLRINDSLTASDDDVVATGTGNGYVYQERLSDLTVHGASELTNIEEVQVNITGGDADVSLFALDLEKKTEVVYGKWTNSSDTVTVNEPSGEYAVESLDTLGATFDDAEINGLKLPMHFSASELSADDDGVTDVDYNVTTAANDPAYDYKIDIWYRLSPTSAIDVSNSGMEFLIQDASVPASWLTSFETSEGVDDTTFENISWTDQLGSYSEGDNVSLDTTVNSENEYAFHATVKLPDQETRDAALSGGSASDTGGSGGGDSGGKQDGNGLLAGLAVMIGGAISWFWKSVPVIGRTG